ncbi:alpha/beta hydrolase [Parahaliea maris]|uniref:Alpha/beta hydrolase n=1 Tax=Parahaliea maris TaxID=2716870 RepID=A0A5C8ZWN1_9GAMM|nr:alpha/beta hydrolase [Parahaliea maris]TXS91970.1 alpha/beta hydrolase [Parahaliea maris]
MQKYLALLFLSLATSVALAADWQYTTVPGGGGVPLNVVTVGDPKNPPILLVHGIGQSHYSFKKQFDSALADDFYLVAFDLRGHGGSGKPWTPEAYQESETWAQDVDAVMKATGIDHPLMLAWSYGTAVAMDYIRQRGDGALAGLILTGGTGGLLPFQQPQADAEKIAEYARLRTLQVSHNPADNYEASDALVDWLTESKIPQSDRKVFQGVGLMLPVYARKAMTSRSLSNVDLVDQISVPARLMLGAKDTSAQVDQAKTLAANKSNFALSIFEDAGHTAFYEDPDRFNAELRAFAQQCFSEGN